MSRERGVLVQPVTFDVDGFRCALGENKTTGKRFVICSEGVGWKVDPETGFKTNDYDPDCPAWSWEEMLAMDDGEPIDLADWVRVFGDRLERNFGIWQWHLTKDNDNE